MKTQEVANRKLIQKYLDIIKTGTIQEGELNSLMSLLNGGRGDATKEEKSLIINALNNGNLLLSAEQNKKGYAYLMNAWKTPKGVERKNNPFGYREQAILENFSHFEVRSLYDAGNAYRSFFVPLYEVVGDETTMEYYFAGGKVHIVG